MAENKDLSLIITDIQMPNMNGVEFSKQVRADGNDIPIIAITAFDNSTPIINNNAIGSDIGIDKYIQKPADIDDIINAMIEILD
jgi:DNA-binding response OmpR family regulator